MANHNFIDRAGQRYGRLVVVEQIENDKHGKSRWRCRCDCGRDCIVVGSHLSRGNTHSCGCLQSERTAAANVDRAKHGQARGHKPSPTWRSWKSMRDRCYLPCMDNYPTYGGRGITVCRRWRGKNGFQNFRADMGERPDGCTLDRKNSDGNYTPRNCRWSTPKQQAANRCDTPEYRATRIASLARGRETQRQRARAKQELRV